MQLQDGIATVRHAHLILRPDVSRVLFRPFHPDSLRELKIVARVMSLGEEQTQRRLDELWEDLEERDGQARGYFREQFETVSSKILTDEPLSETRKLLIGAYFTQQYSFESAALFNPSLVPHPDQSDLPPGSLRFIVSLRATGEGHLSSITFRTGTVDLNGNIAIEPATRFATAPELIPMAAYDKVLFVRKLQEIGSHSELSKPIMDSLEETFSFDDLWASIELISRRLGITDLDNQPDLRAILLLARSNYSVGFSPDQSLSARVIFPQGPTESAGMEDARFVLFQNDDGTHNYYATYTAYDGRVAIPQLLETTDFLSFHMSTLNGPAIANKGLALFPRKINGHYAMLSRQDNENIHLMFSDALHFWYKSQLLLKPTYPWEFVQVGNCGSPIETEAGWLVISHGVGPLRKYSIGAFLLDRDDPSRVIGRLRHPLLTPNEAERAGYVPNVVYSCGAMVHNGILVLPYAMSDSASTFATVRLNDLLNAMRFQL
ncbi:MAG: glycoside hydrolase family 130 protein [Vulcanimicrobiaceae bacterium]